MMGMGEPLTNFDNVVTALHIMLDDHAYGLSRRRVTVSTVGIVPNIDRLRQRMSGGAGSVSACALTTSCAIAWCRSTGSVRCANCWRPAAAIVDSAPREDEAAPRAGRRAKLAHKWQRQGAPRDFITFEYVMLAGVNDRAEHARQLLDAHARGALQVQPDSFQSLPRLRLRALRACGRSAASRRF